MSFLPSSIRSKKQIDDLYRDQIALLNTEIENNDSFSKALMGRDFGVVATPQPRMTAEEKASDDNYQRSQAFKNLQKIFEDREEAGEALNYLDMDDLRDLNRNFPFIYNDVTRKFGDIDAEFFADYFKQLKTVLQSNKALLEVQGLKPVAPRIERPILGFDDEPGREGIIGRFEGGEEALDQWSLDQLKKYKLPLKFEREKKIRANKTEKTFRKELDELNSLIPELEAHTMNRRYTTDPEYNAAFNRVLKKITDKILDYEIFGYEKFVDFANEYEEREREGTRMFAPVEEGEAIPEEEEEEDEKIFRPEPVEYEPLELEDTFGKEIERKKYEPIELPSPEEIYNVDEYEEYQENPNTSHFGFGLKTRFNKGKTTVKRVIMGRGLAVKEDDPKYISFGKFVLHFPQLVEKNIFNLKYKSLGGIPGVGSFKVSEDFKDFLTDLIERGKMSDKLFSRLDDQEKKRFEKIVTLSKLNNRLGVKRVDLNEEQNKMKEEKMKRFELVRGEWVAGNNSDNVKRELINLIYDFTKGGMINEDDGRDILVSLIK